MEMEVVAHFYDVKTFFHRIHCRQERILPLYTEGDSVNKNFQATWHSVTGRCKLMLKLRGTHT